MRATRQREARCTTSCDVGLIAINQSINLIGLVRCVSELSSATLADKLRMVYVRTVLRQTMGGGRGCTYEALCVLGRGEGEGGALCDVEHVARGACDDVAGRHVPDVQFALEDEFELVI